METPSVLRDKAGIKLVKPLHVIVKKPALTVNRAQYLISQNNITCELIFKRKAFLLLIGHCVMTRVFEFGNTLFSHWLNEHRQVL